MRFCHAATPHCGSATARPCPTTGSRHPRAPQRDRPRQAQAPEPAPETSAVAKAAATRCHADPSRPSTRRRRECDLHTIPDPTLATPRTTFTCSNPIANAFRSSTAASSRPGAESGPSVAADECVGVLPLRSETVLDHDNTRPHRNRTAPRGAARSRQDRRSQIGHRRRQRHALQQRGQPRIIDENARMRGLRINRIHDRQEQEPPPPAA